MPSNGDATQKITIAVIGEKIDRMTEKMDDYLKEQREDRQRIGNLEVSQARIAVKQENTQKDVEHLNTKSNVMDGISGGIAALAAALSVFFGLSK